MAYRRATGTEASEIAKMFKRRYPTSNRDPDVVRDVCDQTTGGELTCYQLDRMVDMVLRQLGRV